MVLPGTPSPLPLSPSSPIQIQLPPEIVQMIQAWPGHVERLKQVEGRLGAAEATKRDGPYLTLLGWSCFLAGILATLGAQFAWMHW